MVFTCFFFVVGSGFGNHVFSILSALVLAIDSNRALLFHIPPVFETLDFELDFNLDNIPASYREYALRLRASDEAMTSEWLAITEICNHHFTAVDETVNLSDSLFYKVEPSDVALANPPIQYTLANRPLKPGMVTHNHVYRYNETVPKMRADLNANLVTLARWSANTFVWHLPANAISESLRYLVQNMIITQHNPYQPLISALFKPQQRHLFELALQAKKHNLLHDAADLGVHIRRHKDDQYFFPNYDLTSLSIFVNTVGELVVTKVCHPSTPSTRIISVFVASDHPETFDMFKSNLKIWLDKYQVNGEHARQCPSQLFSRVYVFENDVAKRENNGDLFTSMVDFWTLSRSKFIVGTHISSFSGSAMTLSYYPSAFQCMVDSYNHCVLTSNTASWHITWERNDPAGVWGAVVTNPEKNPACLSRMDIGVMNMGMGFFNPTFIHDDDPPASSHPTMLMTEGRILTNSLSNARRHRIRDMSGSGMSKNKLYGEWWKYKDIIRQMWNERDKIAAFIYERRSINVNGLTENQIEARRREYAIAADKTMTRVKNMENLLNELNKRPVPT